MTKRDDSGPVKINRRNFLKGGALFGAAAMMGAGATLTPHTVLGRTPQTFEVQMLNKGADGQRMVFEPAFVQAQPGDTIRFIPTDKTHNAELKKGLHPEGAKIFRGKINKEVEVTLDVEGVYGVICRPHFSMGMVMTIAVGNVTAPGDFIKGRIPKKAKKRFKAQLSNL